ncbi:MAG: glycosyltransferase family A protein, partial [Acidimicrobiales bacterium]
MPSSALLEAVARRELQACLGGRAVLDRRARVLLRDGRALLSGGEPFRILRLTPAGIRALRAGDDRVCARLVAGGLAHPTPAPRALQQSEAVIVVPVRDDAEALQLLLESLGASPPSAAAPPSAASPPTGASPRAAALGSPRGVGGPPEVIIVDDGSAVPVTGAAVRHEIPLGPAAARNAVRAYLSPSTRLVCFLDADCEAHPSLVQELSGHFEDPRVAAVAPRVLPGRRLGPGERLGPRSDLAAAVA